ncbi:MAG: PQQ-binding-like beta-propeller repeat protein [Gemmataceae bacterium]|nr:PQQ-binding-like beta-propeller repeat protein [Gemmataceae bacterium]
MRISLTFAILAMCGSHAWAQSPGRWPQFRGPDGRGIAADAKPLPVHFGPDKNLLWKKPLPRGLSSPVVWGDRIFVTAHDASRTMLETICLDRERGIVQWRRAAPTKSIERVNKVNSPATATPCTDGERVYVSFGSFGLLCYDFKGKELWSRRLPLPPAGFGTGTSPVLAGDLLLLNGQGKDFHLLAVNKKTGDTVWTTPQPPFPSLYPAPYLWKNGAHTEVIVPGRGGLLAYDLNGGAKRWWVPGLSPEANTSATEGDGLLFVASHLPGGDPDLRMKLPTFAALLKRHDKNGDGRLSRQEAPTDVKIFERGGKEGVGEIRLHQMYWLFDKNGDGQIDGKEWRAMEETPFNNSLLAIRPGGANDISDTHVAWQARRGIPEVPSPLYYRGRLYLIRNGGVLTCLDAKTGKEVFAPARLGPDGMYYASPVAGDGKVYIASDSGSVVVLNAGPRFEALAENDLGESIGATPALADGVIYVRTAGHLFAFREQP